MKETVSLKWNGDILVSLKYRNVCVINQKVQELYSVSINTGIMQTLTENTSKSKQCRLRFKLHITKLTANPLLWNIFFNNDTFDVVLQKDDVFIQRRAR